MAVLALLFGYAMLPPEKAQAADCSLIEQAIADIEDEIAELEADLSTLQNELLECQSGP